MAELAISLTFLLLLLAGTADLGRAFFTFISLRDAAQEGALYGSLAPTHTGEINDRVCNASDFVRRLCDQEALEIEVQLPGQACITYPVTVVVTYPDFPIVVPFSNVFLGDQGITLAARVTDTILTPRCTSD
jgi:Flp pilus assembly protein TadG